MKENKIPSAGEQRFEPFLMQVARHYRSQDGIDRKCFILPNRRSIAFLRKYICDIPSQKPFLLPEMFTINDFFAKASGVTPTDRVRLLLELYDCYKSLNPKAESLDEFIFWGDVILGDFNDIDKYLADASQLFANVADLKDIQDNYSYLTPVQRKALEGFLSHFNDLSGKLTVNIDSDNPSVKARFLQIWNLLYPLYESFNKSLRDKGMAYEGMIYRDLAQKLRNGSAADVLEGVSRPGTKYVFVGLNALNECEKVLLGKLRDASMAEFCWDWEGDMIRSAQNRSSLFMAANVRDFPQVTQWSGGGVPNVNVVSVPSSSGEAKRLPDILRTIADAQLGGDISKTGKIDSGASCAIVLPDESLLGPVLNSIPPQINDINVTMGVPLNSGEFWLFMTSVSSIQMHTVKRGGKWYFYHKQVWDLFASSIFRKSAGEDTLAVMNAVKAGAKYYIPQDELCLTPLLETIFRPVITDMKSNSAGQIAAFADYQKSVISAFAPAMASDAGMALELEFAKEYYKSINILKDIALEVLPQTYLRLLSALLSLVSVHFKGEPLKGLQIMGPLETRALDFRNLIILSANEGVFPRRNVSSSFIPPELRKGFGLPTYEYQDAVWAYYFYRMISRAENVWMLVDSRTSGLKSGEESRYIKQLEYHFNLPLKRYVVRFDSMQTAQPEEIIKTDEDMKILENTVLSASSIKNYLTCQAKFYYSSIKGLKLEDQVSESLDSAMFGTVYHETMRSLYSGEAAMNPDFEFDKKGEKQLEGLLDKVSRDYIGMWLSRKEEIRAKVKALIRSQINAIDISGRNLVVADVIVRYVEKTLERDLEILRQEGADAFVMLGREVKVSGDIQGQKFIGFIDRMDSFRDGTVRIVDYKTGKVIDEDFGITTENAVGRADRIFSEGKNDRPFVALQFAIYDILAEKIAGGKTLLNSVYSTSKLFEQAPLSEERCRSFTDVVYARLGTVIEQMRNRDIPFSRTSDESVCKYCDFMTICGK